MNCLIDRVEPNTDEFKVLMNYISSTKESVRFKVKNIFKLVRKGEYEKFTKCGNLNNRMMLFHGSKTYNYVGLLSQGIKIAPAGVQVTGWAFGKGIYLADMFCKSYNYCSTLQPNYYGYNYGYPNYIKNNANIDKYNDLLMLINEAALGRQCVLSDNTGFNGEKPANYDSVKACGNRGPNFENSLMLKNGCELPQGSVVNYQIKRNPHAFALGFNEYIIYDDDKLRMQYLIQFVPGDQ